MHGASTVLIGPAVDILRDEMGLLHRVCTGHTTHQRRLTQELALRHRSYGTAAGDIQALPPLASPGSKTFQVSVGMVTYPERLNLADTCQWTSRPRAPGACSQTGVRLLESTFRWTGHLGVRFPTASTGAGELRAPLFAWLTTLTNEF